MINDEIAKFYYDKIIAAKAKNFFLCKNCYNYHLTKENGNCEEDNFWKDYPVYEDLRDAFIYVYEALKIFKEE